MDSIEIVQAYLSGALEAGRAEAALKERLSDTKTLAGLREAARARCAMGLLRRSAQFRHFHQTINFFKGCRLSGSSHIKLGIRAIVFCHSETAP